MTDYSIYLITHKHEHFPRLQKEILPEKLNLFDGTGYDSFSKIINECAASANTETVIMMSYKVTPNAGHVKQVLELLDTGYGFVAPSRFAFFGFRKELFRKMGCMDERYYRGGFEDNDFYIRLKEANIAGYVTNEIPFTNQKSTWGDYTPAFQFFKKKWGVTHAKPSNVTRLLPEEKYEYDFGPSKPIKFMTWDKSVITGYVPTKYTLK
jgi:hypothetical protein